MYAGRDNEGSSRELLSGIDELSYWPLLELVCPRLSPTVLCWTDIEVSLYFARGSIEALPLNIFH